jgi:hypothetical protein
VVVVIDRPALDGHLDVHRSRAGHGGELRGETTKGARRVVDRCRAVRPFDSDAFTSSLVGSASTSSLSASSAATI